MRSSPTLFNVTEEYFSTAPHTIVEEKAAPYTLFNVKNNYIPKIAAKTNMAIDWIDYHTLVAITGKQIIRKNAWLEMTEIQQTLSEAKIEHSQKSLAYDPRKNRYTVLCTASGKRQLFALLNPVYKRIESLEVEEIFRTLYRLPKIIKREGSLARTDGAWTAGPPTEEAFADQMPYVLRLTQAIFKLFTKDVELNKLHSVLTQFEIPKEYVKLNDVRNDFINLIENLQSQKKERSPTASIVMAPY